MTHERGGSVNVKGLARHAKDGDQDDLVKNGNAAYGM